MENNIDWTTSNSDTPLELGINQTQIGSYGGTDLNTYYDTTPVFSGSGETDIVYRSKASDFTNSSLIGQMWCDDAVNGALYKCDQAYINIRSTS